MERAFKMLKVFLLSMTPVGECRVSIPFGISQELPLWEVALFSILGNTLIGLLTFYLLNILENNLLKREPFKSWYERYLKRALKRFRKHSLGLPLSLAIFIAIPLPGTGAFTGAFLAKFFRLDRKEVFFAISLGVSIASLIVSILTSSVIEIIPSMK
ncbi:MAG: COG2426 family protein [Brevinematia bacterium]|jgi:uncharacterized membrane protein